MSVSNQIMHELRVGIEGIALWAPRLPSWESARVVMRGEGLLAESKQSRPSPALLAPTERRRAPDTVALALEVAASACRAAGRPPHELDSVFASTYGDLAITDYMCSTLASTPELISPTKFHNSVHNAAAGYWSIGTGAHSAYTAVSAHEGTFATGLLEAAAQVHCRERPVLFVAYDIEARGALATIIPSRGLFAVAMVLHADDSRAQSTLSLRLVTEAGIQPTTCRSSAIEALQDTALVGALPLLEAIAMADGTIHDQVVYLQLNEHASLRIAL
jgi:hypothetical protein